MDWINVALGKHQWRALVNTVTHLQVPKNFGKFLSRWAPGAFSRTIYLHGVR
jgi:hypothetical protein